MSEYLSEAFRALEMLNEEQFDVTTGDFEDAKEFLADDEVEETVDIIDPDAETEEDIKSSYIGDVVLDCNICHSKCYKAEEEIDIDEESETVNIEEECPFCGGTEGFTVIGKIVPFEEVVVDVKSKDEDEIDEIDFDDIDDDEEKIIEEGLFNKKPGYALIIKYAGGGKANDSKSDWYCHAMSSDQNKIKKELERLSTVNGYKNAEMKVVDMKTAKSLVHKDEFKGADNLDESLPVGKKSVVKEGVGKTVAKDKLHKRNRKLTEAPYLDTQYDSRNSFYNKARISDDGNTLYSYETKVMEIVDGTPKITCRVDQLSQTTLRHIKEFLKQKGFKAETKQQIIRDYLKESIVNEKYTENDYELIVDDAVVSDDRMECFSETLMDSAIWDYDGRVLFDDRELIKGKYKPGDVLKLGIRKDYEGIFDGPDGDALCVDILGKAGTSMKESLNNVNLETDHDIKGEEMIAPLDDIDIDEITSDEEEEIVDDEFSDDEDIDFEDEDVEEEDEEMAESLNEVVDIDIDEIAEDEVNKLGESYLKNIYSNVSSYKTTDCATKGNKLFIEGLITFKSGKKKSTRFVFEAKEVTKRGKVKFIGENTQITPNKHPFTLLGKVKNGKLLAESFTYNYREQNPKTKKSQRVYGRVVSNKRG